MEYGEGLCKPFAEDGGLGLWKGVANPFSKLRQDLIENVRQDAAGVVVIDFRQGIEADF